MSKTRKKFLNSVLIIIMMASLFAGILTIEVKAAGNTHTHSDYKAINSSNFTTLLEDIKDGGNFYLTENITISSRINITSGTVNLCLNGKTITTSGSYSSSLFYVENATLNIYDCVGDGKLTGGKGYAFDNGDKKGGAIYLRHSTLNMYGGTITGNNAVWGGAVFIDGSNSNSVFNMYGGTISSNTATYGGGGIEVENTNSYLNMYAGSIINNKVTYKHGTPSLYKGGGVHFAAGTVNIFGTYGDVFIKDNTVAGIGNNVYLRADKKITVPSDANISSNSSIGVSSADCESGSSNESVVSGYGTNNNNRCFFLDGTNSSSYLMVYDNSSVSIVTKSSHTHSWVQGEATAPSINNFGITHYTCATCGSTKEDKTYLNINDEKIIIENANALTYNGQVQSQKLNVYYDGELLSEDTHYTISGNSKATAGNYNLTITGKGAFEGNRTLGYVINKAPLTITVNNEEITYGDAVPAYTVTYSGFENNETKNVLTGVLAFNCDYAQYSNVGNYDITASGYGSNNYNITYVKGNVKVNPKVVGLEWSNLLFTYDSNAHLPTVTIIGLINGDICTVEVTGEEISAGVHIATAKNLSNDNYILPENAAVEFVIQKVCEADEVTSDDKVTIKEALEIIDNLLLEDNLTDEERDAIEQQKADLEEKLKNINAAEDRREAVDETIKNLPEAGKVTSANKESIAEALGIIEQLLAKENVGNLTAKEKAAVEEQKAELEEKLDSIKATEKKMDVVEETVNTLPEADMVTSANKKSIVEALDVIEQLLAEENVEKLTAEEKTTVEAQKADLTDKLENIEEAEGKMDVVEDTVNNLYDAGKVTSEDKEEIEDALEVIEDLLKEENVDNLTPDEKATIEEQKSDLTEKLEKIKVAEEKMDAVEDTVNTLPKAEEVTSENKEKIEDTLKVIEDLLKEENMGNLTPGEKAAIEEQKSDLTEKLENIKAAEEKMDAVEDTVNTLPKAEEVTSDDKEEIEDALKVIKDLLKEENVGNLTPDEKATVEEQKDVLEEKLANIKDAEEKMESVKDTATSLPAKDKVTSDDKETIEDVLEVIDQLLAPENVGNLTEEEKVTVEDQKADLAEKLDVIQRIEDALAELQNEKDNIPSKEVITTESKDDVAELLDIIKDLQENHPDNLTEEKSDVVANLKDELQEKMNRIQAIEDSLNEIENESTAQPDYDDITSDNKEDIKDIIENIENILKDEKENLSREEVESLEEQKKELEDKVTFIEQLEKYEPVSGDFENTTEPKKNDSSGDLRNESHELIEIIPLGKTEKEHVAKGESVKVYLEVTDITETIAEDDKKLIKAELINEEAAIYFDFTLFKQIGNREPKKVFNTNKTVTITIQVPRNLINTDSSVTRKYQVVRVHEGKTSIIDVIYDENTGEVSFETDKFSIYALIYEDVVVKAPQAGDTTLIWPWMLLVMGLGIIVISAKTESMNEN